MAFKDWFDLLAKEPISQQDIAEGRVMKLYLLKFKDEVIRVSKSEYEILSDYRWERKESKQFLTVVYGNFVEEGVIERLEDVKEGTE
jgi:hypothetical protein